MRIVLKNNGAIFRYRNVIIYHAGEIMSNVILLHLKLCILSQPMKLKPEKFISNNVAIGLGTSRHFEKKSICYNKVYDDLASLHLDNSAKSHFFQLKIIHSV